MAEVDAGVVTPEVTPPAADAVIAPETQVVGDEASPEGQEPEKPQPKYTDDDLSKKIGERLSKERKRIERAVRAELERDFYKQQLETVQRPKAEQPQGKPKEEDFAGKPYSEYVEALADWIADQKAEAKLKSIREETAQQQQERETRERMAEASKRLMKGADKYPDFREVVGGAVPFNDVMAAAIPELDNPADVAYYLANNVAEIERIRELSPVQQIWELREVSRKLTQSAPTKAPAPIKPNSGNGKSETGYRPDMTDKQFAEWRRRQKAQKR